MKTYEISQCANYDPTTEDKDLRYCWHCENKDIPEVKDEPCVEYNQVNRKCINFKLK